MAEPTRYPAVLFGGLYDGDYGDVGVWPPVIRVFECPGNGGCDKEMCSYASNGVHWAIIKPADIPEFISWCEEHGAVQVPYVRDRLEDGEMVYVEERLFEKEHGPAAVGKKLSRGSTTHTSPWKPDTKVSIGDVMKSFVPDPLLRDLKKDDVIHVSGVIGAGSYKVVDINEDGSLDLRKLR